LSYLAGDIIARADSHFYIQDTINGLGENDIISGGIGSDVISGGLGQDVIGDDALSCELDAVFVERNQ
jgi:Ca2+-binding RTX toxin-like protein